MHLRDPAGLEERGPERAAASASQPRITDNLFSSSNESPRVRAVMHPVKQKMVLDETHDGYTVIVATNNRLRPKFGGQAWRELSTKSWIDIAINLFGW